MDLLHYEFGNVVRAKGVIKVGAEWIRKIELSYKLAFGKPNVFSFAHILQHMLDILGYKEAYFLTKQNYNIEKSCNLYCRISFLVYFI